MMTTMLLMMLCLLLVRITHAIHNLLISQDDNELFVRNSEWGMLNSVIGVYTEEYKKTLSLFFMYVIYITECR